MTVASLPSPGGNELSIGPIDLNAYGLMIALGVVAAVWLFGRRLEANGFAKRDVAGSIAVWAVIAGVVGARLYHVITDWSRFEDDLGDIPKVWQGGLGIPGGLIAGIPVGIWMARRHGISAADAATCAAPALPLAQAIGRWGNWFNQELFGRPTDLPWGLEIDPENRPTQYAGEETFHPTFLYESLWNLALCGLVLWIDRRWRLARGALMAVYIAGYGIGRFWVEGMRIDDADEFAGLRVNQWVAALAAVLAIAYIVWVGRQGGITRRDPSATHPSVEAHPSVEGPEAGPSTLG
ncbi:prolipoprotein diacylglyceryl transferase [Desertimonas flava]|uniref:prolipoprotein diacylglyceryl transferase n=1 Tax=Desertimonas flava TaxID=2064846 RepID=UPI000E34E2B7|nr:prolipoprotein diacylglyceryl transferase [Desertimonas flava]